MYQIHVKMVSYGDKEAKYKAIRPTGSPIPYEFATENEARTMARICYPDHLHLVKIFNAEIGKYLQGEIYRGKFPQIKGEHNGYSL